MPQRSGYARRVTRVVSAAAATDDLGATDARTVAHAALVHDLGAVAVPVGVWQGQPRPGSAGWEQVRWTSRSTCCRGTAAPAHPCRAAPTRRNQPRSSPGCRGSTATAAGPRTSRSAPAGCCTQRPMRPSACCWSAPTSSPTRSPAHRWRVRTPCLLYTTGGPDAPLDPATAEEIDRVLIDGGLVQILGGTGAVSTSAEGTLHSAGYAVERRLCQEVVHDPEGALVDVVEAVGRTIDLHHRAVQACGGRGILRGRRQGVELAREHQGEGVSGDGCGHGRRCGPDVSDRAGGDQPVRCRGDRTADGAQGVRIVFLASGGRGCSRSRVPGVLGRVSSRAASSNTSSPGGGVTTKLGSLPRRRTTSSHDPGSLRPDCLPTCSTATLPVW